MVQEFAAHNGEILAATAIPSAGAAGSVVISGGHDWQVLRLVFDYMPACTLQSVV